MGHFAAVWDQRASIEITKDWNGIDQVTLRSPRSASARLAYMVVKSFHGGVIKGKNFYSQVVRILRRRRGDKTSKTSFALPRYFSSVLDCLKYATSHEWVKHEGPVATIGITDHAQDHLGEVVFVELPETGVSVSKGSSFGAVESVKATSDVNSPISGEVVEVNSKLTEAPGMINSSPYKEGWMIKVKPSTPAELDS